MPDKPFKKGSYALAKSIASSHGYNLSQVKSHCKKGSLAQVRKEIMISLFRNGLHKNAIALLLNRDITTVIYHVEPNLNKRYKNKLAAQSSRARKYLEKRA